MAITPNDLTIRERALQALETHMRDMRADEPPDDPYTITWEQVSRSDLGQRGDLKRYALSIIDGPAEKDWHIGQQEVTMEVALEWRCMLAPDELPSPEANRVLGEIERRVRENPTLDGLVSYVRVVREEIDIDEVGDRVISGISVIEMRFKHGINDPRKYV